MPAAPYIEQPRAISDGRVSPGATLEFFESETLTPAVLVYADPELTIPLANPLTADASGRWPAVYLDPDAFAEYRARCISADGLTLLFDDDPVDPATLPYARPGPALDETGAAMSDATLTFFAARTTILLPIYDSQSLTDQLPNPVTADDDGVFPLIFMDNSAQHRVIQKNGNGELVYDIGVLSGVEVQPPLAPPVLSGVSITEGNQLSWTPATAGSFPIDHYVLERSADAMDWGEIATVDASDPLLFVDTDVEIGQTWFYRVRGFDTTDEPSEYSNTVELETDQTDPDFGDVVLLLTGDTGVLAEWTGVPNVDVFDGTGQSGISNVQVKFGSASYHNQNEFVDHTNFVDPNDDVDLTRFIFTGEFTMEGWFYRVSDGGGALSTLFANSVGSTFAGYFFLGPKSNPLGNALQFQCQIAGIPHQQTFADLPMGYNQWMHIAVTRDASNVIRVFKNGVPSSSTPTFSGTMGCVDPVDNATHFTVCEGVAFVSADFDGYFDQIRVTKGVCRYNAAFTPPTDAFPKS